MMLGSGKVDNRRQQYHYQAIAEKAGNQKKTAVFWKEIMHSTMLKC
jgi:hypothetical protein